MKQRQAILVATIPLILIACSSQIKTIEQLPSPEVLFIEATNAPTPVIVDTTEAITLTDAFGRAVLFDGFPSKIISLSSSITESLFAIGAADLLVARDSLSTLPEEAMSVPDFGDQFADFNAQNYIALTPDLVLANENFPFESIAGLEALGIPVFILSIPQDIDELMSNIFLLASLTDQQESSDSFLQEVDQRLSAVELALQNKASSPFVFYELEASDPDLPWTIGGGTILDEILNLAGAQNAGAELSGRWVQFPLSELQALDPAIILLADAAFGVLPESIAARPGWESLSAVANGQIYAFDDIHISNPGPSIINIIENLALLMHPDSFD